MRRREFITLVGGAAAWPLAARAQQTAKIKRVAFVQPAGRIADIVLVSRPWIEELNRLGYVEGQNLIVEWYSAEGRTDHYSELARSIVSTHPDVIYVLSNLLTLAFKASTATIPIVASVGDPVAGGIVTNIARPNGNITGVSADAGLGIVGKRFELLLEAIPKPSKAKVLISRGLWDTNQYLANQYLDASKHHGVSMSGALLEAPIDEPEYRRVFAAMEQDRVDALMVSAKAVNIPYAKLIVDLAAKSGIPATYAARGFAVVGGLMAYGYDTSDSYRQAANAVGQILKGANPGDIPFYQATKYELVINVKAAKALGLEIPPSLLLRADEVIE